MRESARNNELRLKQNVTKENTRGVYKLLGNFKTRNHQGQIEYQLNKFQRNEMDENGYEN